MTPQACSWSHLRTSRSHMGLTGAAPHNAASPKTSFHAHWPARHPVADERPQQSTSRRLRRRGPRSVHSLHLRRRAWLYSSGRRRPPGVSSRESELESPGLDVHFCRVRGPAHIVAIAEARLVQSV
eukprot:9374674-Pyramimonas_sp.AAC.1